MPLSDFDFELPDALIARAPLDRRDASRLLILDRATGQFAHRTFLDWPGLLRRGDLVVLNDTRVIPARLLGRKQGSGGRVELLLVRPDADVDAAGALSGPSEALSWVCLGQASKGLRPGTVVDLEGGKASVVGALGEGELRVRFEADGSVGALLERTGRVPLPPYVDREPTPEDRLRYQTVYARTDGSVAAPTAGLHLTAATLAELEERGVERCFVTLDVGPGTFLPVRGEDESTHRMHAERFQISAETAAAVHRARAEHRRVVAVGTTVVRTLESAAEGGSVRAGPGSSRLFIRPPYEFQVVDALLTNFHLPRSTLLMLVSAFTGRQAVLAAYRAAVAERYRFFSYGDAMFIAGGVLG
ncbi:MAG TPA: tRNA preQ1(34) S-adenosylmethionine ribosyltransferase-isomerase QueA [Myxococcaceae bacterium]